MNNDNYVKVFRAMLEVHLEESIKLGNTDKRFADPEYQLKRFLAFGDVKWMHELMLKDLIEMALCGDFPDFSGDMTEEDINNHIVSSNFEWDLEDIHKSLHEYFGIPL